MTSGKIYIVQQDDELIPMEASSYDSEDLLQTLLERYPDLMAGEQMNEGDPRRWLLVSREFGVPDREGASDRWSLDHLFVDQDGVPTLVEVKRSSDTRIRREVVGQMLDYAANAVVYWPLERIQAQFEAGCQDRNENETEVLLDFLEVEQGPEEPIESFWLQVKTNLQAGRIRMVFVADQIPAELKRIVEFLNQQMDPAEVYAVEIRQFVGQGLRSLVPRLIGLTAEAQQKKASVSHRSGNWDEDSFFTEVKKKISPEGFSVMRKLYEWSKIHMPHIWWGNGKRSGSCFPEFYVKGVGHYLFALWTYGNIEMQFQHLIKPPFNVLEKRLQLLRRFNEIEGINFPEEKVTARPSFPAEILADENQYTLFLKLVEGYIEEVKRAA